MITYRIYENPEDIEIQEKFWLEVTKFLPWPWKPNKTQEIFAKRENFDPRSKYFAFDGEKLVGYQSFVDGRDMIALGYPWVIIHPQKNEIQNNLWNHTLEVINRDFPGVYLLQRFREQWTDHIQFFLDRGFQLDEQSPIYIHDIQKSYNFLKNDKISLNSHSSLDQDLLKKVLSTNKELSFEKINQKVKSALYLDYDICVYLEGDKGPISYTGTTIRRDVSYAEIALLEFNDTNYPINFCNEFSIKYMLVELSKIGIKNVSITVDSNDPIIPILKDLNFSVRSKSVYVKLER